MPATITQRPARRAPIRRPLQKAIIEEGLSSPSSSDEEDGPADVEDLRRSRSAYYGKSSAERLRDAKPMAQEKKRKSAKKRTVRKARASTTSLHMAGSRSQVSHRRRRRKKEENDEEGLYVYKQAPTSSRVAAAAEPNKRRSSSIASKKRSVSESSRAPILGRLGLVPPQRRTSTRSIKKPSEESLHRRHSYHGDTKRRLSTRDDVEEGSADSMHKRRSVSVRETSSKSKSNSPVSPGKSTQTRRTLRSAPVTPVLPIVPEEPKTLTPSRPRPTSMFGSLFSPSKPPAPEVQVTCLTCLSEDIPVSRSAKLSCGHRMCHPCLKRIFTLSVTDPAHMPPKCCTIDCIPLKHVEKLFDTRFKVRWNRKYQEYTTKNRIYCPSRGCGAWIPPKDIRTDPRHPGRKYGKCVRCKTRICASCNNKWHAMRECPNDEATRHFVEMAKEKGWQRCFNCKATVELKEGCNHMTCRCTAEFCMICGAKWKSCDCPWFNYAAVETDRLNHMNIAQVRRAALDPQGAVALHAPRAYHEELERRRAQELQDEEMARRMQGLDIDLAGRGSPRRRGARADDDPAANDGFAQPAANVFAVGNAARHFLNDDFVQRANNILTAPYNDEQRTAADRLLAEIRDQQRTATLGDGLHLGRPTLGRRDLQAAQAAAGTPIVGVVPGRGREAEVLVPRRVQDGYETQAARVRPRATIRRGSSLRTTSGASMAQAGPSVVVSAGDGADGTVESAAVDAPHEAAARPAILAGLTRKTTQGRVDAWRRHVPAEGEAELGQ